MCKQPCVCQLSPANLGGQVVPRTDVQMSPGVCNITQCCAAAAHSATQMHPESTVSTQCQPHYLFPPPRIPPHPL